MSALAQPAAMPPLIGTSPTDDTAGPAVDRAVEAAFESLFRRCYPAALRFATSVVGRFSAEDVVQSAFLGLWKQAIDPQRTPIPFHDEQQSLALVLRAVSNGVKSVHRAIATAEKYKNALAYELRLIAETAAHPMKGPGPRSLSEVVHAAIDSMPTRRAAVYRLVKMDGMSYEQAGDVLGISPSTVHQQVVKANKFMANYLAPYRPAGRNGWYDVISPEDEGISP